MNFPIDRAFVDAMSNGVPILDTVTRKCKVEKIGKQRFRIVLTQGLNRQIRRMCRISRLPRYAAQAGAHHECEAGRSGRGVA